MTVSSLPCFYAIAIFIFNFFFRSIIDLNFNSAWFSISSSISSSLASCIFYSSCSGDYMIFTSSGLTCTDFISSFILDLKLKAESLVWDTCSLIEVCCDDYGSVSRLNTLNIVDCFSVRLLIAFISSIKFCSSFTSSFSRVSSFWLERTFEITRQMRVAKVPPVVPVELPCEVDSNRSPLLLFENRNLAAVVLFRVVFGANIVKLSCDCCSFELFVSDVVSSIPVIELFLFLCRFLAAILC